MRLNIVRLLSVLMLVGSAACSNRNFEFTAGQFYLKIDQSGQMVKWSDGKSGINYLAEKQNAPLMQLRIAGEYLHPDGFIKISENQYQLSFPGNILALLDIKSNSNDQTSENAYLKLSLTSISSDSVDLIVWGPYPLSINETVGETIGVVRDSIFAIGIQSLNLKTLGGFPTYESDVEPSYDIFETGSLIDIADSVKVFYRGQTARKEDFGSVIQAYTRNRNQDRIIQNWNHERYLAPAFDDGGVAGSSIALFSCKPDRVLSTLSNIETNEGLAHPTIDGEWAKTSRKATAAYIITSFGVDNFEDALDLAKKAGLRYLYHDGPFKNWGHFDLNEKQFPENWETLKLMVARAAEEGLTLGVHTLSNFITTNDPYVTPIPDPRLAKVGFSILTKSINDNESIIEIKDPGFFNQMKNNTLHAAVIENEIICYTAVSESEPWSLLNCERGAFGTVRKAHPEGVEIGKLMDHGYRTFLTNNDLSIEVSDKIADFFNFTGCGQISFDGLEGNWSTGMGQYGRQRFTQNWYDKLNPDLKGQIITDASNPGHFFWHMFTRMNWGEPWYAGFRESQTQYRLLNQLYFNRNYIPAMLGWFRMTPETSIEDIEWLLARSAGFDAGYAMVTSIATVAANGFGDHLLDLIKLWESARMAGAFPEPVKEDLRNIKKEYHLEANGPNGWTLYPYEIWRSEYTKTDLQPGQPNLITMDISNPNPDQPLQFILTPTGEGEAYMFMITIDGARETIIPMKIPSGHHLKYTGGSYLNHYDPFWNLIEKSRVIQDDLTLTQGNHQLVFQSLFSGKGDQMVKLELKTAGLGIALE